MNTSSLLSLLHLSSPSLPIGAFAYSQGLESAVELEWVKDQETLTSWLDGIISHGLAHLDIPVLRRLYICWQQEDMAAVTHWQDLLLASRESAELVKEELQLGTTFARLLRTLDLAPTGSNTQRTPTYLGMYAYAAQRLDIPLKAALTGWLWSWLENQVVVACKTIPLGQTPAQKILLSMHDAIQACIETGLSLDDEQIGMTLPAFAMVSAWHEEQYSRLFRS